MKTKTTISISKELHEQSKEYAENNGQTFSGLVSVLLRNKIND